MQVTKLSVILDTTHMVHGMLEQGGVSGRRVSYPLADVLRVTGLTEAELRRADENNLAPKYAFVSIREAIEHHLGDVGIVVRRGRRIE